MRAIDFVRILGPSIGLIAAVVLFRRKKLFQQLRAAGATGPESAQPIDGTGLTGFWRRKLLAAGVLRPASGDRFWLDVETWRAYQARRKRRALTVVAIVGTLALATVAYVAWRTNSGR
jgi:hypothetical protein